MKFQKFVKALGSDGIVYNRKNGERWLASDKVFMKIPEDIVASPAPRLPICPNL